MNITAIQGFATQTLGKSKLLLNKHAPEIFLVIGITGGITATIMACNASRKIDGIIEETKAEVKDLHDHKDEAQKKDPDYTDKDFQRDLFITYSRAGMRIVKLYAPSAALGAVSIGFIVGGHSMLTKRNVALMAAYKAMDEGFKKYRGRVASIIGEENEKSIRYESATGEEKPGLNYEESDSNLKESTVKNTSGQCRTVPSDYARWFDENSPEFRQANNEMNMYFLKTQQLYANEKLKKQGHLFLNEVYDMLRLPRSREGSVVGWVYDHKAEDEAYVDFRIYEPENADFVNGYSQAILIDPNVQGVIWDLI